MNNLKIKRKFLYILVLSFLFILNLKAIDSLRTNNIEKKLFKKKFIYVLTYNSVAIPHIFVYINYFKGSKGSDTQQPEKKHYYIVKNWWELVRVWINVSFSRTRWYNAKKGAFWKVNAFENTFTYFSIPYLKNFEHTFIGIAAIYGGLNVSYNKNGGMYRNKVNIGGKYGVGFMWNRFYWLLVYNYKNEKIYYNKETYPKLEDQKKIVEGCKFSSIFLDWRSWLNCDIVVDLIPFYIQFKNGIYLDVEFKIGIADTIGTIIDYQKRKKFGKKSQPAKHFKHLFRNFSINVGIY